MVYFKWYSTLAFTIGSCPLPFRPERRKIKLACWHADHNDRIYYNLLLPDSLILAQNAPKMRFAAGLAGGDPVGILGS